MVELEKEIMKEEKKIGKFFANKSNIWMIISVVLAVGLILSLIFPLGMSKDKAGATLVTFLNTQVVSDGGVTLKDVQDKGDLFLVNVLYKGQEIPVYLTKDGQYFIQSVTALKSQTSSSTPQQATPAQDAPKSDKPKVDLYVFAYCPYGTQTEKGIIPVYNLLKDKADINIVYIGAMHGDFEKVESLRQLCIQKLYGKDIFMNYLSKFDTNSSVGNCQGTDSCVTPIIHSIFSSLNIDSAKIDSCMASDAPALYSAQESKANSLGISGSPTITFNGVQLGGNSCNSNTDCTPGLSCSVVSSSGAKACTVGRDSESLKNIICLNTFNNIPGECNQTLSATSPSAGFGGSTGGSSAASCG